MPLVNTLRYLRLKNKYSQAYLAVQANICQRSIRYYESGTIPLPQQFAERIAAIYKIDFTEIIGKNRQTFIDDAEYDTLFPMPQLLDTKDMDQIRFLGRPKLSLTEVYKTIINEKKNTNDIVVVLKV